MINYGTKEEDIKAIISMLREYDNNDLFTQDDQELAKQIVDVSIMTEEWGSDWLVWEDFMGEQRIVELKVKFLDMTYFEIPNNLKALRVLKCPYSEIESLYISNLVLLEELECHCNMIDDLDLNNAIKLKKLDCSSNRLDTLYVDNSPELVWLDCSSNNLSDELDLSDNTKLEEVFYDDNDELEEVILPEHLK